MIELILTGVVLFGVSAFQIWLEHRFEAGPRIGEGEVLPEFDVWLFGYYGDRPFWILKLPSWEWRNDTHYAVLNGARMCWHRRWLMWRQGTGFVVRAVPE